MDCRIIPYEIITKTDPRYGGEFMIAIEPLGFDEPPVSASLCIDKVMISYTNNVQICLVQLPSSVLQKIQNAGELLVGELSRFGIERAYEVPIRAPER